MPKTKQFKVFDEDRVNPEFRGISHRYSQKKKERQELQQKLFSLEKNVNHFEKTHQNIDQTLQKRKHQIKYLQSVKERHLNDLRNKMSEKNKKQQYLEQLRLQSSHARLMNRQKIECAKNEKKKQKMRAKMAVIENLTEIKKIKQEQQEEMKQLYEMRLKQQEDEKSMRQSRINKFFRKKNKAVLNNYRTMLHDEDFKSNRSRKQINFLETKSQKMDASLNHKTKKLKSIEDEIRKLKEDSKSIYAYHWTSVEGNSRVSRRSSHPTEILKDSLNFGVIDKQ